jgi:O-antigen/teichoic acid export membrane protein
MKDVRSGIPIKPGLVRDILTLFTGNAIAFIIPVLVYPVLSRIFSPGDYALFGLYAAVFGFLEIASAGRYDFSVVLPEQDEEAVNLVAGGLAVALLFSLLVLVLVFLFGPLAARAFNNPAVAPWLWLLPLGLFFISASKLCNAWLIRVKNFRASSINKASQKIAEVCAQLALGITKTGNGLIFGDVLGRFFNALVSYYQSLRSGFNPHNIHRLAIWHALKRYRDLPKFGILPSMLNALGGIMPVLMISSHYSTDVSGSFNFSRLILSVPFALIAAGISQVLMQQVSVKKNERKPVSDDLFPLALKLAVLSLIATVVLFFAAPSLFELVFGTKWRTSGVFTSILILSTAVSFIVSPFTILLVVLGRIRWLSIWQVFYFVAISVLWFLPRMAILNFLMVLVIVDVLSYSFYGVLIYQAIVRYEKNLTLLN